MAEDENDDLDEFDWSQPIPVGEIEMETPEAQADYVDAIERARMKIAERGGVVVREFLGYAFGAKCFVFYFGVEIGSEPRGYWIVMGDLPPAVIPGGVAENAFQALNLYMGEMAEWVEAVREGRDVSNLVPVSAPPTLENADLLDRRLKLMYEHCLKPNEDRL